MKLQRVSTTLKNGTPLYVGYSGRIEVWQTVRGTVHYLRVGTLLLVSNSIFVVATTVSVESLQIMYAVLLTEKIV